LNGADRFVAQAVHPGRHIGAELLAPVFITGSDSPASSRGMARLLTKTLPRVTAIEMEGVGQGVGHMGPMTHPDRDNALIERYLTDGQTTPTE